MGSLGRSAATDVPSSSSLTTSRPTPAPPTRSPMTTANSTIRLRMSLGRYARGIGSRSASDREEGFDELVGVELDEVLGRLTQADQLDGQAQLGLDGEGDAALG